jgi:hypothetical protein
METKPIVMNPGGAKNSAQGEKLKHQIDEWHEDVYHAKENELDINREEWRELRKACLERDHHKCFRCEKESKSGKGLSTHHMMPRSMGGTNDLNNLITLCDECHDIVEENKLMTRVDILASLDKEGKPDQEPIIEPEVKKDDWHTWVYGGARRPGNRG